MYNSMKIISETFESEGQETEALTIILDGRLKSIFEIIREEELHCDNSEILREIISIGINNLNK